MKKFVVFILSFVSIMYIDAQEIISKYDFSFENTEVGFEMPKHTLKWGSNYVFSITQDETALGNKSLCIYPDKNASSNDFGCLVFVVPASFSGKTIQAKAMIKCDDVKGGKAAVFMRIDGGGNTISMSNTNAFGIDGTHDWKLNQTLVFNFPDEVEMIYVGVILNAKGKIWVDDLKLLIDGKNYIEAALKKIKLFPADADTSFARSSGIDLEELTNVQIMNLALLCKIWGFLKYYHPAIAEGNYNWDNELFRFIPDYIVIQEKEARNKLLISWIDSLGPLSGKGKLPKIKKTTRLVPDLEWIKNKDELGDELSLLLLSIQKAKRNGDHYYFSFVSKVGNPKFNHEKGYEFLTLPDDGFRLLTLFRYWNAIQYFYPYRYLIDGDWKDVPAEFIPRLLSVEDETSYKLLVLELISRINDTHAVIGNDEALQRYFGRNYAPYKITFIENKAVVTDYLNPSLLPEDALEMGDVIVEVNGEKIEYIIERLSPYIPASNYDAKLKKIASLILRSNNRGIHVTVKRDGKTHSKNLSCHSPSAYSDYISSKKRSAWRFLTRDIGYIYMASLENRDIGKVMSEFRNTKGLVIDIRCYPRNFTVFTLSRYFLKKNTEFVKFTKNSMQNPGYFSFSKTLKLGKTKNPYLGKIVILVNEQTISSAEYHAMAFRTAPGAVIIGSTTAAADGNVSSLILPGNIRTQFTGIGIYYPDGGETQKIGIVPDIEVRPSIEGVRVGRDEVLEKAIEVLEKKTN